MALGSVYEPDTILKGVKMLPEASFAFIKNFSINILKYYSINYNTQLTNDIEFILNSQLQKSVNNQLISDAPIGVFLSGGLDSSVLTYYASINQKK